jgi:GNAT superfamily N-acetyltransferase
MNVRQALPADALRLSSLCVDVQTLHAEHHPDIFKVPQSVSFAVSFFEEVLADPAARIFIAEEEGHAVGYISFKLVERPESPFTFATRLLHIDQISIRPAVHAQGIGRALMQQAERLAREWHVKRMQLDSWDFNVAAHGFFEHLGFRKFNYRFWRHV